MGPALDRPCGANVGNPPEPTPGAGTKRQISSTRLTWVHSFAIKILLHLIERYDVGRTVIELCSTRALVRGHGLGVLKRAAGGCSAISNRCVCDATFQQ